MAVVLHLHGLKALQTLTGLALLPLPHGLKALQTLTGLVPPLLASLSPANILNVLINAGLGEMDSALSGIMILHLHLRLSVQMVGESYAHMQEGALVCATAAAFTSTK